MKLVSNSTSFRRFPWLILLPRVVLIVSLRQSSKDRKEIEMHEHAKSTDDLLDEMCVIRSTPVMSIGTLQLVRCFNVKKM